MGRHGSVVEWSSPNHEVVGSILTTGDHVKVSLSKTLNPDLLPADPAAPLLGSGRSLVCECVCVYVCADFNPVKRFVTLCL